MAIDAEIFNNLDATLMCLLGDVITLPDDSTVEGVFAAPYEDREFRTGDRNGSSFSIPLSEPSVLVRDIDEDKFPKGSIITVHGQQYDVVEPYPTGDGLVAISLVETQKTQPAGDTSWR